MSFQAAVKGVEEKMAGGGRCDKERFTVVGKLEFGPLRNIPGATGAQGIVLPYVKCCKRGFVIVAKVIEKNAGCRGGGNSNDRSGRIICS